MNRVGERVNRRDVTRRVQAAGGRIAELRKARGLTQEQLAERLGVDKTTVSKFETAGNDIRLSTLYRLAEALDVEPGALLVPAAA